MNVSATLEFDACHGSPMGQGDEMPRRQVCSRLVVYQCLFALLGSAAWANDQEHTGFAIGFGVGPNLRHVRVSRTYSGSFAPAANDSVSALGSGYSSWDGGVSAQIQIGFGLSPKWRVHLTEIGELQNERRLNSSSTGITSRLQLAHALTAVGFDHRLGQDPGPWFLTGGVGWSTLANELGSGPAVFAGVGRDYGRLAQARLLLTYGGPASGSEYHQDRLAAVLLFGLLWR